MPHEELRAKLTDAGALNEIAVLLSGNEWSADTLCAIADVVAATGRVIEDIE